MSLRQSAEMSSFCRIAGLILEKVRSSVIQGFSSGATAHPHQKESAEVVMSEHIPLGGGPNDNPEHVLEQLYFLSGLGAPLGGAGDCC